MRAILKEWREKRDWIYLRSICYKYDLPYFKSRNFLSRLARDNIVIVKKPEVMIKPQIIFQLTSDGLVKLKQELLYASTI